MPLSDPGIWAKIIEFSLNSYEKFDQNKISSKLQNKSYLTGPTQPEAFPLSSFPEIPGRELGGCISVPTNFHSAQFMSSFVKQRI